MGRGRSLALRPWQQPCAAAADGDGCRQRLAGCLVAYLAIRVAGWLGRCWREPLLCYIDMGVSVMDDGLTADMRRTCAIAAILLGCDALDLYADYLLYRADLADKAGVADGE